MVRGPTFASRVLSLVVFALSADSHRALSEPNFFAVRRWEHTILHVLSLCDVLALQRHEGPYLQAGARPGMRS